MHGVEYLDGLNQSIEDQYNLVATKCLEDSLELVLYDKQ